MCCTWGGVSGRWGWCDVWCSLVGGCVARVTGCCLVGVGRVALGCIALLAILTPSYPTAQQQTLISTCYKIRNKQDKDEKVSTAPKVRAAGKHHISGMSLHSYLGRCKATISMLVSQQTAPY